MCSKFGRNRGFKVQVVAATAYPHLEAGSTQYTTGCLLFIITSIAESKKCKQLAFILHKYFFVPPEKSAFFSKDLDSNRKTELYSNIMKYDRIYGCLAGVSHKKS